MSETMLAGTRGQQITLLALVVGGAALYYYLNPSTTAEVPGGASNTSAPQAQTQARTPVPVGVTLPEPLRLAALEPVPETTMGARDPFGFGVPPRAPDPPPAPPRPAPAPAPEPPRDTGPPPRPPIPVKFLGFAEVVGKPGKVVSLSVNGAVVLAREGDVVDGRYRLLKVGLESIVMAYLDGQGQQTIRQSGG